MITAITFLLMLMLFGRVGLAEAIFQILGVALSATQFLMRLLEPIGIAILA